MKRLFVLLVSVVLSVNAFGWGQKGHDVVAYIAECNLAPKAAAKIEKILGGHTPVYYANWLDNASHTKELAYTKTWHYLNIDEGKTFETMEKNKQGDVLVAVNEIYAKLKEGNLSQEEEALNLKMLIHLVGDMHCPMHLGRKSDRGGNRRQIVWFGRGNNLHKIWDTNLPEAAHKWSYSEWQRELDRLPKAEKQAIAAGTPEDWARQTHAICVEIYEAAPEGTKMSYDYVSKYTPVVEQQFLRGGLRLARLLNEIYK